MALQIGPTKSATIKSIGDMELANKRVFMRLDFNVPLEITPEGTKITDTNRIDEAIPTIRLAIDKGARLILASHLGRPDGKVDPKYSLEPVALALAEKLACDVTLAQECVGDGIEMMAQTLKNGQVLLLENLRFHAEEEANDLAFCQKLARLADVYITDAFGTAHRKHASTYGLPSIMPVRGTGLLIEKELKYLEPLIHSPARPFYAILGGSKVTDKIKTIEALMRNVNGLLIGGAMAHAFWKVIGREIPKDAKQPKDQDVEAARQIIAKAKKADLPLLLPSDTNQGFDIGPKTVAEFSTLLQNAQTVFWNGPLGWFEKPEYAKGTFDLAAFLAKINAVKVVGGGDTVSAIKLSGHADAFQHLSTGGGAVLEYLENGCLPGIEILKNYPNQGAPKGHARI